MKVYVINLARSPERKEHMIAELARTGIGYEFIEAVEGRDLDLHDPGVIDPSVLGSPWVRAGSAGAAYSHLRVYQKVLADGAEHALVLEDDIRLPADLISLVEGIAPHLTGAEVALLNYDSPQTCLMSREHSVRLASGGELMLPLDVDQPRSSAAYLVTEAACKRMASRVAPYRAHSDNWGHHFREGALDRVRCVLPMPIWKDPKFESTIDYGTQGHLKARMLALADRYQVALLKRAIAYRRARIWQGQIQTEVVDRPFVNKPSRF
jgi:glycosyl transferase family 25